MNDLLNILETLSMLGVAVRDYGQHGHLVFFTDPVTKSTLAFDIHGDHTELGRKIVRSRISFLNRGD